MMRIAIVVAAALSLAGISSAAAQSSADVRGFVDSISLTVAENKLASWDNRICVGAVGLAPAEAQALVDRISARAGALGLRPGEPGCRANVMVIYAPDSDTLTRQIVDQRRDLLGYFDETGQATAGRAALEDFANTPRPIRWWHISSTGIGTIRPDAQQARQSSDMSVAANPVIAGPNAGFGGAEDIEGADAVRVRGTRARADARNDLTYALIVVDARRVAGVPASAWMDYVAFVALAQVDPYAETGAFPTVLNLFRDQGGPATGLTAWDEAYLTGLYRSRGVGSQQVADIVRRMSRAIPN